MRWSENWGRNDAGRRLPLTGSRAALDAWFRWAAVVLAVAVAACGPPRRPLSLTNQAITCEQANEDTLRVLQGMYFKVTQFEPATVGRPGTVRGERKATVGYQNVTVQITCDATAPNLDAREDGPFARPDFAKNFYTRFTMLAAERSQRAAAVPETSGLKVLIEPVTGPLVKVDFDMDITAGGILPVRVTIHNITTHRYTFDPNELVLLRADGTRVQPLAVEEAAQRLAAAESKHPTAAGGVSVNAGEAARRLERQLLRSHSVSGKETVKGYLFYPPGEYVQGRFSLEDEESEESTGFLIDM